MTMLFNIIFLAGLGCLVVAIVTSLWGIAGIVLIFCSMLWFMHRHARSA
jgi:hypothetical protein